MDYGLRADRAEAVQNLPAITGCALPSTLGIECAIRSPPDSSLPILRDAECLTASTVQSEPARPRPGPGLSKCRWVDRFTALIRYN